MHVDCSLPLWAFFDIYGTTNKLESLGRMALDMVFMSAGSYCCCFGSSCMLISRDFLLQIEIKTNTSKALQYRQKCPHVINGLI